MVNRLCGEELAKPSSRAPDPNHVKDGNKPKYRWFHVQMFYVSIGILEALKYRDNVLLRYSDRNL